MKQLDSPRRLTPTARRYVFTFFFRLAVFCLVLLTYALNRPLLDFTAGPGRPSPLTLLWLAVLLSMVSQLNPRSSLTAGCLKQFPNRFDPVPDYDPAALDAAVRRQDLGALKVLLVWLAVNGLFGLLYWRGLLAVPDLVVLCALAYLCDLVCVLFFCPFQFFLMGNRCCINCRIFAWGAWMMAAPLMWVPHFYAQSLFWTGVVVLIFWEVRFRRHPERFWSGSNRLLQCASCREQLCRYKRPRARRDL